MKYKHDDPYIDEVVPLIEGLGFNLVELTTARRKGTLHASVILYAPTGVTLDDCAEVYTTLLPRLEVITASREIHLEVSSPGLSRAIKSGREFELFKGKGVQLLTESEEEWIGGTIEDADERGVTLRKAGVSTRYDLETIRKAKLDESQEEE
ncbi:MAG: ribosome assembly cofactor RimP [Alkalispirochaetaceae bacterium]